MKEFFTAAKDTFGEVSEDEKIVFKHDGREVTFFQPSDGQMAIMLNMGGRDMDPRSAGTFIQLWFSMMDNDTVRYFQTRLMDRDDKGFDLESEGGVFDIFESLVEEWSARPTKQPSDFQPSRRATGPKSTGSTRVRASTSSGSTRSRASSQ